MCRSWAGLSGWPSWTVSHRTLVSMEGEMARSLSWPAQEGREGENMMIKSCLCLIKSAQSASPVRASHYWVETDPACTFYSSGSPYCVHENPSWQWHERPQAKLPWLLLSNVYSNQIRIVSFALLVVIWNLIVTFGRLFSYLILHPLNMPVSTR